MDERHTDMFFLSILMAVLLGRAGADPPYTFTEGTYNAGDAVFANCTFDMKGTANEVTEGDLPMNAVVSGAKITYINVQNNKPSGEQGTIAKTSGGVGSTSVNFHLTSVKNHGFLFHFEIRGTTPSGTTEPPVIGSCRH